MTISFTLVASAAPLTVEPVIVTLPPVEVDHEADDVSTPQVDGDALVPPGLEGERLVDPMTIEPACAPAEIACAGGAELPAIDAPHAPPLPVVRPVEVDGPRAGARVGERTLVAGGEVRDDPIGPQEVPVHAPPVADGSIWICPDTCPKPSVEPSVELLHGSDDVWFEWGDAPFAQPEAVVTPCEAPLAMEPPPSQRVVVCVGADVVVDGTVYAERLHAEVDVFPFTLPPTPAAHEPDFVEIVPPDLETGEPARITVRMCTVTIHRPGHEPPLACEPAPSLHVVPHAWLVVRPCPGAPLTIEPTGEMYYCVGADVDVDGARVVQRQEGIIVPPLPLASPVLLVDLADAEPVRVTPPDMTTGEPTRLRIALCQPWVHAPTHQPPVSCDPSAPDFDSRIGPSVRVVPCRGAPVVVGADGNLSYCVGADVYVEGQQVASRVPGEAAVFPITLPPTPRVRDGAFFEIQPPDPTTGQEGYLVLQMEQLTLYANGNFDSEPAEPVWVPFPGGPGLPAAG